MRWKYPLLAILSGLVLAALGLVVPAAGHRASSSVVRSSALYGAPREGAGDLLAAAGDVNGDKRADVITTSKISRGAVVVFGSRDNSSLDLSRLRGRGFRISAAGIAGGIQSVSGAGDVNGDGRADLIVGTPAARDSGGTGPGSAYVVFGKRSSSVVRLSRLAFRGFRIVGERRRDRAGAGVSGMGDLNGDGLGDVVVGAPRVEVSDRNNAGAAYIVFGKRGTSTIELSTLGNAGTKIAGARSGEQVGNAVAQTGDMNGDGINELLLGASRSNLGGRRSGAAYVVYGRRSPGAVKLAQLGGRGFLIRGAARNESAGFSVAGLKDVNGDKLADIAIGAPGARNNGRASGSAYVVFGRRAPGTVRLAKLSKAGFRVDGAAGNNAGFSVAGASDESRDGRGELIVGAPGATVRRVADAGTAYVVYGTGARRPRTLDRLGNGGFRLSKMRFLGAAGVSVAEAGDMNSDGRPELLVGAPSANYNGRRDSGAVYVFRGL